MEIELTDDELKHVQQQARHEAFERSQAIVCRDCDDLEYWLQTERERIVSEYVPDHDADQVTE